MNMKSISILILLFFFVLPAARSQQSFIAESTVINIEVPVRVFEGTNFVDDLTIDDFLLLEDGVPQRIEAVYLVEKDRIERSEEKKKFLPRTQRNFFLFLDVSRVPQKLLDAMEFFVQEVLLPEDNLIVITPVSTYRLKEESLAQLPRDQVLDELKELVRPDALKGDAEFRSVVAELGSLSRQMQAAVQQSRDEMMGLSGSAPGASDPGVLLVQYAGLMSQLQTLRQADELQLLDLARYLKSQDGQNYVFVFYEQKNIPLVDSQVLKAYTERFESDRNIVGAYTEAIEFAKKESRLDVEKIRRAFADSSTAVHFLHIAASPPPDPGLDYEEHSMETYDILREISDVTGGFSDSSTNPDYLFHRAVEASESYYLLYYTPKTYTYDGRFRSITVKVRDRDCRVMHRAGYFCD